MSWNYRVVRDKYQEDIPRYTIRECYYADEACKIPNGYTEIPVRPEATSLKDLRWQLKRMLKATKKKPLRLKDFNGHKQRTRQTKSKNP